MPQPPTSKTSGPFVPARRLLPRLFLLIALAISGQPVHARPAASSAPDVAEKRADLDELRNRIEGLRKELSASEGTRADASDRLRESERQISRLQQKLHELGQQRGNLQRRLETLEAQSHELGKTLLQQQAQLEKLLYRQYLRGNPDSLHLLLNGNDPNQMARDLHYLSAIAATRAELMGEVSATIAQKKALAADTRERTDELSGVETEQKKHHAELEKQRQERKALHAELSNKVRAQRQEIGSLQRDEKRMSQLVDRLSKILAQQAAARAAEDIRRRQAAQAAAEAARRNEKTEKSQARNEPPKERSEPPARHQAEAENRYEPAANNGSFARQKGKLRLPTRGTVVGRFGGSREGGGQWRGLFIRAGSGSEVKAVASGRVVFSEWMRGFGNLLIIDHGDAYLSIYGNNESLLKQVGQAVSGGETIASVGNTGGNQESGLYFEIRHKGQPIDPLSWASLK
ncbi:murein hydrolase activator EnvC [Azonexus sp.]|uniref:murein hydrolase activator EnvC family protein n=1 Tax=Azonexus sp. TaxID=1872668 RepID=UPI0027B9346E|nr:peptidoglycan DD-metalloendopeptidase family protein [Azonexus sp.]